MNTIYFRQQILMKKIAVFILLTICAKCTVYAQDIHFSQFNQTPQIINPAMTGMFKGNQRVILNFREQWKSISTPYQTFALAYDMGLMKKKWDNAYLGVGFFVFRDQAGDSKMSTTQFNLSLSSIIKANEKNSISAGLQGGFAQRSVDYTEVKTDNQYVNGSYDPNQVHGETGALKTSVFGDFTAGIAWKYYKTEKHIYSNVGASVYHINKPKQEFYSAVPERLYSKIAVHANTYFGIKENWMAVLPSVLYMQQGPTSEIEVGLMLRYKLKEGSKYTKLKKETALLLGAYYRAGDAIIPAIALEISNFAVGVSYDVNMSGLTAASSGQGGIEISIRYLNPNPFKNSDSRQGPSFF
ncbi:MAG TPA: type IX secretion system membrane protein PorP/SprF [Flavobacteriales bacterium]|nr:type IX secretion system membrane protein PorP/SprF [Flavobacteriales bacterium]